MNRFVILSFAFLGWAFYELSGGANFEPHSRTAPKTVLPQSAAAPATTPPARAVTQAAAPPAAPVVLAAAQPAPAPAAVAVPIVRRQKAGLVGATAPTPTEARIITSAPGPAAPAPQAAPDPLPPQDLWLVSGNRVNMRGGPGTAYSVLATLTRGQEVVVLNEPGNGWAKLKVVETGRIGWMSVRMLRPAPANP